jgi:hypothetical protein
MKDLERSKQGVSHLEGGSAYVDLSWNTSAIISPPPAAKSVQALVKCKQETEAYPML